MTKTIRVMTTEERQLLLADLCARLPYGVNINLDEEYNARLTGIDEDGNLTADIPADFAFSIDEIKPYLRPMESMTDEEGKEYNILLTTGQCFKLVDYLNRKMFDYRGLIPMGLALPTPDGMYNGQNN